MSTTITRRSAITAAAVAVVGGVAGYLWGRNSDAAKAVSGGGGYGSPAASGTPARPIVSLARVPDGGGVITGGLVVVRDGSTVHAFSSRCTHLGCTVNKVSKGKIFCPCHGSVFDARTGAVLQSPASSPLPRVNVTVKGGEVYTA